MERNSQRRKHQPGERFIDFKKNPILTYSYKDFPGQDSSPQIRKYADVVESKLCKPVQARIYFLADQGKEGLEAIYPCVPGLNLPATTQGTRPSASRQTPTDRLISQRSGWRRAGVRRDHARSWQAGRHRARFGLHTQPGFCGCRPFHFHSQRRRTDLRPCDCHNRDLCGNLAASACPPPAVVKKE